MVKEEIRDSGVIEEGMILTMRVNVLSLDMAKDKIFEWASEEKASRYVCVSNVHMCMETMDSEVIRRAVNSADMIVPDGRPLAWCQKFLGFSQASQVRGEDLMVETIKEAAKRNISIGMYGGAPWTLEQLSERLFDNCDGINIGYSYAPPFRPLTNDETDEVIRNINSSQIKILFVGLGCPKQELWMANNKGKINCVMIGVGAAFDFISGNKKSAPRWMQKSGFEWIFRLISEPRRLWKRYLIHNTRFIIYFLRVYVFKKQLNNL